MQWLTVVSLPAMTVRRRVAAAVGVAVEYAERVSHGGRSSAAAAAAHCRFATACLLHDLICEGDLHQLEQDWGGGLSKRREWPPAVPSMSDWLAPSFHCSPWAAQMCEVALATLALTVPVHPYFFCHCLIRCYAPFFTCVPHAPPAITRGELQKLQADVSKHAALAAVIAGSCDWWGLQVRHGHSKAAAA